MRLGETNKQFMLRFPIGKSTMSRWKNGVSVPSDRHLFKLHAIKRWLDDVDANSTRAAAKRERTLSVPGNWGPAIPLDVKTNGAASPSEIGLAVYPGATPAKSDKGDKDTEAADVNLSFGDFHLKVKAAGYHTPDSPDKVKAFYLKEMAHFGDVIECQDKKAIGKLSRTKDGLSCDDEEKTHTKVHITDSKKDVELKAGSKLHQHIVGIEPKPDGTKFGLVALELPNTDKQSN
jgi:hypothetical protein